MTLEDLAEFMYLAFSQSVWKDRGLMATPWKEKEDWEKEAWMAAAQMSIDQLT